MLVNQPDDSSRLKLKMNDNSFNDNQGNESGDEVEIIHVNKKKMSKNVEELQMLSSVTTFDN
jgi:hypothetical protein